MVLTFIDVSVYGFDIYRCRCLCIWVFLSFRCLWFLTFIDVNGVILEFRMFLFCDLFDCKFRLEWINVLYRSSRGCWNQNSLRLADFYILEKLACLCTVCKVMCVFWLCWSDLVEEVFLVKWIEVKCNEHVI